LRRADEDDRPDRGVLVGFFQVLQDPARSASERPFTGGLFMLMTAMPSRAA
jgi:hypothetical protein